MGKSEIQSTGRTQHASCWAVDEEGCGMGNMVPPGAECGPQLTARMELNLQLYRQPKDLESANNESKFSPRTSRPELSPLTP